MPLRDRPRVLLLWPGGLFEGEGNFGVPQILSLAGAIRARTEAAIEVIDLDLERALGPVDVDSILRRGWDLIAIACYSSYDYLKVMLIAERARALAPRAWIVTGGYHASARPNDFTHPQTPFDFVIVGDGERPLARLVEALVTGKRPLQSVLGPESVPDPSEAPPLDWSLLDRYRPVARTVASQAEIYLSRGCPYDCSFCMERAKRDVSWRALEPGQAVEELHRLDRFLDLSSWTLFIADALFGMKIAWRRSFLELLAQRPIRARKIWLLIRLDLIEREDMALFARANVAPGFGLESGDQRQLERIRKAGKLTGYLDHMMDVASWAHEAGVPFGANVIVGHPGETEASLRTSAAYLSKLFLDDPRGTMGFLSVDPFRLYPGSPIDEELPAWERETGVRVHRYPWWHDGDQDFLAEWVDPSSSLDFRRAFELRRELFTPILRAIPARFAYQGPARDYFVRSIDDQVALTSDRRALRTLGMLHLWEGLLSKAPLDAERDRKRLTNAARGARKEVMKARGITGSPRVLGALTEVPRERFVRGEDVADSAFDVALALDDEGRATISALHAYARSFDALGLGEGDSLVDLGGGSGYGAALAAHVVGPAGHVTSLEIDPALVARAKSLLEAEANVEVIEASAHEVSRWAGARKVCCAFAIPSLPPSWADALAEGGVIVAPIGGEGGQTLTRFEKIDGRLRQTRIGEVMYVPDRTTHADGSWHGEAR